VRHCLLFLFKISGDVEPARYQWLRSYFSGRIQRIRMGDCVWLLRVLLKAAINEIAQIFEYLRLLFDADDMKLSLPVRDFQDCLKIKNDLVDWCGANLLELNVGKCKSITLSRLRHPVEFSYMLGGIIFVDSITDFGVVMDSRMSFSRHATVGKVLPMLGFVKKLLSEFRDHVSFARPKLEYASCVWRLWRPFYDVHINRIERVLRKFVRCGWTDTDTCDLPPYVDRCALMCLETLTRRRSVACVMFFFRRFIR
jgi:hypothetical protein